MISIFRWKVVKALDTELPLYKDNVLFNVSPNTGLYSQFGIPLSLAYVPQVLSPTITYHQTIKNLLKKRLNVEISEKKVPFRIFVPYLNTEVLLSLQIRVFPPNILSVTVNLSDFCVDLDPIKLIEFQRLDRLQPISDIVQWTIGMTETLSQKNFDLSQSYRYYPALHLSEICAPDEFGRHFQDNALKYAGILIRNYDYELMDVEIPNRLFEKNRNHNLKSSQEVLLVDKQGILYLTPSSPKDLKSLAKYCLRTQDLFEIAVVISTYLRNYLMFRASNEDLADFLLYRIQTWINEPEIVLTQSETNQHIWRLLLNETKLPSILKSVMKPQIIAAIAEKSSYFDRFATGWWAESDFSYLLNRTITEASELELGFLSNDELKRSIIEDYNEARKSLQSRNYKAAVLLCGSIAEALLTAVVDAAKMPGITTSKLYEDYNLAKLLNIAKDNNLIKDKNLYMLIDPLRNYRNAIHPGVKIRNSISLDSSTARIAIETINLLIRDLGK